MTEKQCSKCKENKPLSKFSFRNKAKKKYMSWCKECIRIYDREYYSNSSPAAKAKKKENSKNLRRRNSQYVWDYLKTHPCVDCGEDNPIVLEFDHIKDKEHWNNNISNYVSKCSIDTIQKEIEKCEVRCANCHRIKTAKQLNWYKNIIK